jgi:NADPH:quinone reductase-like Zn-dependent oxidoreductase
MAEDPHSVSSSSSSYFLSFSMTIALVVLALPTALWLVSYVLPQLYMTFRPVPDLKKKYNATWALVTGGGSGIGKALVFKLASQGFNVVVVSLDDDFLKATIKELEEQYPTLFFRAVGANFAPGVDYMKDIKEATEDIAVQVIFNNAGFLVTGTVVVVVVTNLALWMFTFLEDVRVM